jgi:RHS repeat-associated protein
MPSEAGSLITREPVEIFGQYPGYGFAGIGVSTAIGNFTQSIVDLTFTPGLLNWQRTYNSHSGAIGALGPGWTTSFSASLVVTPAQGGLLHHTAASVTFHDEDGRILTFTPNGTGGFTGPQDLLASLTQNTDGSFSLTFNSGEVWSFTSTGQLTGRSMEGQQVTLDYGSQDLPVRATHQPTGRYLAFSYDANRRLTSLQASDGRTVGFGYSAGDVTSAVLESVTAPGGGTTQFEWSGTGQAAQISKITDPDGNLVVANAYDESTSRVTSQQYPAQGDEEAGAAFRYDDSGLTTVTTKPTNAQATFQADANGRMVKATDPGDYSASFSYDGNGYLTAAVTPGGTQLTQTHDANGNLLTSEFGGAVGSWTYDGANRVTSATSPTGGLTSYVYQGTSHIPSQVTDANGGVSAFTASNGLITARTDQDGNTTSFAYNAAGDLTSVTLPLGGVITLTHDAAGQVTELTAPSGATNQWSYDGAGRVVSFVSPDGSTTTFSYSAAGLLLQQTVPGGVTTSYGYDGAGNLTSITDALGNQSTMAYDALGNQTSTTDADGNVTQVAYNGLRQVTGITGPDGTVTSFGYDPDSNIVRTESQAGVSTAGYDARGNNISVTDETGATMHYGYDASDRLTSTTDPLGRSWQLGYDALGNVVSVTDASAASATFSWTGTSRLAGATDPIGRQFGFIHDANGRVTGVTDALGGTTQFAYDPDGRRIAEVTPAGLRTSYEYDQAGRVIAVIDPRGWITRTCYDAAGQRSAVISPAGLVIQYRYDGAGRMTELIDGNGSITRYGYDPGGGLISMTDAKEAVTRYGYDRAGRLISTTDPLNRITTRAYDASGNLITLTDPSGHEQHMAYDGGGRLTQWSADDAITVSFTYDAAGQRTSMTDATGTTHYTYDANGNLLTITWPDGEQVTAAFDAAGQRTSLSYPGGLSVGFSYDLNGRLVGLTDSRAGAAAYALDPDGRLLTEQLPGRLARRYRYEDGLLRQFSVIRDGHPVAETAFSYDPDGRIQTQLDDSGVREFRYDGAAQLVYTGLRDRGPNEQVHLVYDAVGNRVSLRHGDVETHYVYDDACQLTSMETRGRRVEFRYDSSGRLTERIEGERREVTTYDGFGLPATTTRTRNGETEVIRSAYDGNGLLAGLVLTKLDERRDEEHAASVRYRWASGDPVPQILTQRGRPALDDAEHDRPGGLDADFAYGYGRTFATAERSAASFHHDAYGSQVRTEETRDWAQAEHYDAFGVPGRPQRSEPGEPRGRQPGGPPDRAGGSPSPAPELPRFGYRGELALGATLDLRARAYAADLGRFTSRDPVPGDSPYGGQPANPYIYAGNDPVNFTDPLGTLLVGPGGASGAVRALVPATVTSPRATANGNMMARTVATLTPPPAPGSSKNFTTVHNIASVVGAGVLAAQLLVRFGTPRPQFGVKIDGAPKRLRRFLPAIPSADTSYGWADVVFNYPNNAVLRVEIWEAKTAQPPHTVNQAANLAQNEARWYSLVYNQRATEPMQFEMGFAEPGPWMTTQAWLPIPKIGAQGPGMLQVFSQTAKFGGILYRVYPKTGQQPPPPPPDELWKYDPSSKKIQQVDQQSLNQGQINAQQLAIGAGETALLAVAAYAAVQAAPGVLAVIAEILATLGEVFA